MNQKVNGAAIAAAIAACAIATQSMGQVVSGGNINRSHATLYGYYDASEGLIIDPPTGIVLAWLNLATSRLDPFFQDLINVIGTPMENAGAVNGHSTVFFDGQSALWAPRGDFGEVFQPNTYCFVLQLDERVSDYVFDSSTSAQRNALQIAPTNNPDNWSPYAGVDLGSPVQCALSEYQIHTLIIDGAGTVHYINGAEAYSGDAGTQSLWGLILGARFTGGNTMWGEIAEFMVYDEALNETDRGAIEGYLSDRYGIALGGGGCYPDCDPSTGVGVLDLFDFLCFQNSFVSGEPYACDCDTSTGPLVCDLFDFLCFQDAFVNGCP